MDHSTSAQESPQNFSVVRKEMEASGGRAVEIARFIRIDDLDELLRTVVDALKTQSHYHEVVAAAVDTTGGDFRLGCLHSSSPFAGPVAPWLCGHLAKIPTLIQKLYRGETVRLNIDGAGTNSQSSQGIHALALLVPVLDRKELLVAVLGFLSPTDNPEPTAAELDWFGRRADEIAPVVARLRELEYLRRANRELPELRRQCANLEEKVSELSARNSGLESAIIMRSHVQSTVAHELRTPLAAVRGYTRMVLEGRAGGINDQQREYLESVTENTDRLIHLVNWMSRIAEKCGREMVFDAFDLRELWLECLNAHKRELLEGSISFDETASERLFPTIGDKEKMRHAFREIIRTAAQFSRPGARITSEFYRPRKGGIAVRIAGITEAIPADVSEFPSRVSSLGFLAEAYDIIGLHGGRFFVRHSSGEGSVFLFTLPDIRIGTNASADRLSA